jgi:formylglycine-generating enzyme required for sulfatase activity
MRLRFFRGLAGPAIVAIAACGIDLTGAAISTAADAGPDADAPDVHGADAGGDDGSSAPEPIDAGPDAHDDAGCPIGRGPTMVRVGGDAGTFCIDVTEVTNAHYAAFLADPTHPSVTTPAACSAKGGNHLPHNDDTNGSAWPPDAGGLKRPVICVDWCDAYAFCRWAGKRMCGALGGGDAPFNDPTDMRLREWTIACSANGTRAYPYGAGYIGGQCNDGTIAPKDTRDVASLSQCHGGASDAIFDQSGNVEEWEGSCDGTTSMSDHCIRRGGSFMDNGAGSFECLNGYDPTRARSLRSPDIGIRCCAN